LTVNRSVPAELRAAAHAATFFLKVLPMLPSRPVDWLTGAPAIEKVRYPSRDGAAEGDLYRPPGPGPHPAMLVCLGVVPFAVDHPQVPILGKALARSGFAALLYWSPAMRDFRLQPEDVEDIALAYRWLVERPDVDSGRSGLMGTCVGGSFALMAAANPLIRERVAFVAEWAGYASMWTFARDIASASRPIGGSRTPWAVDPITRKVYVHSMTAVLEPAEAELLRGALAKPTGSLEVARLSEQARAIYPLLTALDPDGAQRALERLPATLRTRLDALSPIRLLEGHSRATRRARTRSRRSSHPDRRVEADVVRVRGPPRCPLHRDRHVPAHGPDQAACLPARRDPRARQVLFTCVSGFPAGY
jgi:hypothetical protein